jgi:hypothetical protein
MPMDRWQLEQMKQQGIQQFMELARQKGRDDLAARLNEMNVRYKQQQIDSLANKDARDAELHPLAVRGKEQDIEIKGAENERKNEEHRWNMDVKAPLVVDNMKANTAQSLAGARASDARTANLGGRGSGGSGRTLGEKRATGEISRQDYLKALEERRILEDKIRAWKEENSRNPYKPGTKEYKQFEKSIPSQEYEYTTSETRLLDAYQDIIEGYEAQQQQRRTDGQIQRMREQLRRQFPDADPGDTKREPTTGVWLQFDGKDWIEVEPRTR